MLRSPAHLIGHGPTGAGAGGVMSLHSHASSPPHARTSLFDSCHRKIRLIGGGPVAFLGGLVAIIHLMQPLVSYLCAIIYYSVMIIVSLIVFVVIRSEITSVTLVVFGITGILLVMECYLWCRMIESIEDTMEMIADYVAPLGFRLQHSVDNHSEYIEMRTSIMIVLLNASQCDWFICGGIFPISVESFGNLCMIIYKFATFLLKFD